MMNCVLVPLAKIYKEIGVIANTETVRNKSGVPEAFQAAGGNRTKGASRAVRANCAKGTFQVIILH